MRVLIVGGLGYIGSALIEHYKNSGKRDIKVDVIDKRFVPHVVAHLPENFQFVHGDMRDASAIKPLLARQPDIVYLLAAEVHAESSIHRARDIWENNFEAMVTVIEQCPAVSRLMFASTGNVFGGVDEQSKNMDLTEDDEPRPKYPYAESKLAVERYLLASNKDFVICRFGTNYGYAPAMRFNLVTNNFIKKALSGETITIHGSGENFRPTVCVQDAVRALEFLGEKKDVRRQIIHIVGENFKIKDLAREVCRLLPTAQVEFVTKEIPFKSYHLSNKKMKRLGFTFEWDVERALLNMKSLFSCIKD